MDPLKEATQLLESARQEITQLRQQNNIMGARLEMFDSVMLLFRTEPNFPRMGMSEDVNYRIEKFLASQLAETKTTI